VVVPVVGGSSPLRHPSSRGGTSGFPPWAPFRHLASRGGRARAKPALAVTLRAPATRVRTGGATLVVFFRLLVGGLGFASARRLLSSFCLRFLHAPVAQRKSSGLLSRGSGVRILPGA